VKKLAEVCVVECFEVLAFCQISYEHLPTIPLILREEMPVSWLCTILSRTP
jgi:hypothetical protein